MILIFFKFGERLLSISPRIINALGSYIKHLKEGFNRYPNTLQFVKKTQLCKIFSNFFG